MHAIESLALYWLPRCLDRITVIMEAILTSHSQRSVVEVPLFMVLPPCETRLVGFIDPHRSPLNCFDKVYIDVVYFPSFSPLPTYSFR